MRQFTSEERIRRVWDKEEAKGRPLPGMPI